MLTNRKHDDLTVLVLCGGKGERLSPLTDRIPKPLIPINGVPILTYLITYFEKCGFSKYVIATGYRSRQIVQYIKHHHSNLAISVVDSGDADIIKRIQDAAECIPDDFIMCYGDTLADVDLDKMIDYHRSHDGILTLTAYPLQSSFGVLDIMDSGRVLSFMEKPILDKWINIGYFYFSKECMYEIKSASSFVAFLHERIERQEMYSFKHRGVHITVNTITELRDAENNIATFKGILSR